MSYEGGVMPSDVMQDITPRGVIRLRRIVGKGALGLGGHLSGTAQDFEPDKLITAVTCRAGG